MKLLAFLSFLSATLQGTYVNKLSNALSNHNKYRGRQRAVSSEMQQVYLWQLRRAENVEQVFELMKAATKENTKQKRRGRAWRYRKHMQ